MPQFMDVPRAFLPYSNAFFAQRQPPITFGSASRSGIATLQNPMQHALQQYQGKEAVDALKDAETLQTDLGPIVSQSLDDPELLKAQYTQGGEFARQIMGAPAPKLIGGRMDYQGAKPFRGTPQDLFANPKFTHLARKSPEHAARVYKGLTGRDLMTDLEDRRKADLARTKDFSDNIRTAISRGELRQNADTGLLERLVKMPDPKNPLTTIDTWQPAEAEMQAIGTQNWESAIGSPMARKNPLTQMGIHSSIQPLILARYRDNLAAGQNPRDAMTAAIKSVPDPTAPPPPPSSTAAATPTTVAATPPPTDPVKYQEWALAQIRAQSQAAGTALNRGVTATAQAVGGATQPVADFFQNRTGANRVLANMGVGLYNLPGRLAAMVSGQLPYQLKRPTTPEEYAAWIASQQQEAAKQRDIGFDPSSSSMDRELYEMWQRD